MLMRFLTASANWCGMLAAIAVLSARVFGLIDAYWLLLTVVAYVVGYQVGVLVFGAPRLRNSLLDDLIEPITVTDDRATIRERLAVLARIVDRNPDGRLNRKMIEQLTRLGAQINAVLAQIEQSDRLISLEDSYNFKRVGLDYLPNLVHGYLSLPKDFASQKVLERGKTAEQIFEENLQVLAEKMDQLADDLTASDAQAFLVHAQFLHDKFGQTALLPSKRTSRS